MVKAQKALRVDGQDGVQRTYDRTARSRTRAMYMNYWTVCEYSDEVKHDFAISMQKTGGLWFL